MPPLKIATYRWIYKIKDELLASEIDPSLLYPIYFTSLSALFCTNIYILLIQMCMLGVILYHKQYNHCVYLHIQLEQFLHPWDVVVGVDWSSVLLGLQLRSHLSSSFVMLRINSLSSFLYLTLDLIIFKDNKHPKNVYLHLMANHFKCWQCVAWFRWFINMLMEVEESYNAIMPIVE